MSKNIIKGLLILFEAATFMAIIFYFIFVLIEATKPLGLFIGLFWICMAETAWWSINHLVFWKVLTHRRLLIVELCNVLSLITIAISVLKYRI